MSDACSRPRGSGLYLNNKRGEGGELDLFDVKRPYVNMKANPRLPSCWAEGQS